MDYDTHVIVSLASAYTAPAHVGTHYYTIRATADGGAYDDTDGEFLIYHWCYAVEADTVEDSFSFYIPESEHQHENFPSDYSAFVKPPGIGCYYYFYYDNYGSSSDSNLVMDEYEGTFKLENVATEELYYELEIYVESYGSLSSFDTSWAAVTTSLSGVSTY